MRSDPEGTAGKGSRNGLAEQVNGRVASDEDIVFFAVSPGFFDALSMPLKMGRDFSIRDDGRGIGMNA